MQVSLRVPSLIKVWLSLILLVAAVGKPLLAQATRTGEAGRRGRTGLSPARRVRAVSSPERLIGSHLVVGLAAGGRPTCLESPASNDYELIPAAPGLFTSHPALSATSFMPTRLRC
jgi:hypothetical protein